MSDDGILKFSNAGGVSSVTRYPNFLTNYGDYGALQRIAYQTGNGTTTSQVIFNNIPQTYQDLYIVFSALATTNNFSPISMAYATNGGQTYFYGNGSSASSGRSTNSAYIYMSPAMPNGNLSSTAPTSGIIHILNYANTSTYKTFLARIVCDANGSGGTELVVASSATTSGITSLTFGTNNGSNYFTSSSTFELFGVKASNA